MRENPQSPGNALCELPNTSPVPSFKKGAPATPFGSEF